jgi:hypothetical protein
MRCTRPWPAWCATCVPTQPQPWAEAETTAVRCMKARVALWDDIGRAKRTA